jgi:Na+-translocating ferredoxin:NAD+ oxidoreductase RnfA subunit
MGRIWVVPTWLLVLAASGPVLAMGLLGVYLPSLRTVPVVLCLAVIASLAAAAFPELAPLVVQAAVPGAALAALAASLRFVFDKRSPTPSPTRGPAAVVSASSLTQVAPQPSLIINPASTSQPEGATAVGRNQP